LEKGVNPNINDSNGYPILFRMAENGNNEMIELYLSKGGNINVINENGWNILHYFALNGDWKTTKYLVSIGCDYKAKDIDGKTPLDLAKQKNTTKDEKDRNELIEYLKELENTNFQMFNSNQLLLDRSCSSFVKRIKLNYFGSISNEGIELFHRFADNLKKLRHENLLAFLGISTDGLFCLEIENLQTTNLYLELNSKRNDLDWCFAYKIVWEIAQGMLYLHKHDILHRGLKSLNVLLTKNLDVKLSGFGIVTLKEELTSTSIQYEDDFLPWTGKKTNIYFLN